MSDQARRCQHLVASHCHPSPSAHHFDQPLQVPAQWITKVSNCCQCPVQMKQAIQAACKNIVSPHRFASSPALSNPIVTFTPCEFASADDPGTAKAHWSADRSHLMAVIDCNRLLGSLQQTAFAGLGRWRGRAISAPICQSPPAHDFAPGIHPKESPARNP